MLDRQYPRSAMCLGLIRQSKLDRIAPMAKGMTFELYILSMKPSIGGWRGSTMQLQNSTIQSEDY